MQSPIDGTSTRARAFDVAGAFLQYFFDLSNKDAVVGNVYAVDSTFNFTASGETTPTVFTGVDAIKEKVASLPLSSIFVDSFDAQESVADSVVILVDGREIIADRSYTFSRTMVLAKSATSYYLKTDIIRYGASTASDVYVGDVDTVAETPAPVAATKPAHKPRAPRVKKEKATPAPVATPVEIVESAPVATSIPITEVEIPAVEVEVKKTAPKTWANAVSGQDTPVSAPVKEEKAKPVKEREPRERDNNRKPREQGPKSEMSPTNLYVSRISGNITADDLTEYFSQFGTCKKVDLKSGTTYTYVYYESPASCDAAIAKKDHSVKNIPIGVTRANPPKSRNPSNPDQKKSHNHNDRKPAPKKQ